MCPQRSWSIKEHKGAILQVFEGLGRMKAKDWPALRKAFWKFVREPLMTDPGQNNNWKELADDAKSDRELGKQLGAQLGKQGQIQIDDDAWTVRWYTLCYSCMHFDALTTLLTTLLSKKSELVPELTSSKSKSLLHVDLGCGPGTASWAVVKYLWGRSHVSTIGFDHNKHMIGLARSMTSYIAASAEWSGDFGFCTDRNDFEHRIEERLHSVNPWNAVVVTANAFFGQNSLKHETVDWIVDSLRILSNHGAPLFVIGTHPEFNKTRTTAVWGIIAKISGTQVICDGEKVSFETWNPIRYDDASAWCKGAFGDQVAHAFRLVRPGQEGLQ